MSPAQSRAARALLNWSQEDCAKWSSLSKRTIAAFELRTRALTPRSVRDLIDAFEAAGIEFIHGGVRLGQGADDDAAGWYVSGEEATPRSF